MATKKTVVEEFEEELAALGLADFFVKVLDREDMDVEVLSTGLPRLDKILHCDHHGLARGRIVEIFSKDPEVGKTSLALQIGQHWQALGQKVAIVDIEDTITEEYLLELRYVLNPTEDGIYPVYFAKGFNSKGEILPAEEITNNIGAISNIVDLVIIDSIGALAKRADLEKEAGDATMGGIGKIMWEYTRKFAHSHATSIWINQALPQIGVFSPAGIKYKTGGGAAIKFKSTIRLDLRLVEKLKKSKDDDPYGVVIDVYTDKNKVSPPYKHIQLTYLNGEGFSQVWDLYRAALDAKIIEKSGSWFSFNDERLGQGELNAYQVLKASDTMRAEVQAKLDQLNTKE